MKKTSFLLLWFLLGLGLAGAQSSLSLWGMKLREEAKFHSLGQNATLLLKNADGLKLNDLLLLTSNINDTVRLEATNNTYTYQYHGYTEDLRDTLYTATANTRDTLKANTKYVASIPAGFHLGKGKMTHAGITADGMVFFANADSIRPHNDKWDGNSVIQLHNRKIYNYLYFALQNVTKFNGTPDEDKTLPTPLFATANTKIGYETVGDTLFIAYENIRMVNGANNQTVSWNYQINLKTGEIGLQTKGFFQTTGSANDSLPMNMRWGIVTDDIDNTVWLDGFDGVMKSTGIGSTAVRMGKNAQKFSRPVENAIYQFFVDAPACVEVEGATITWSDNIRVTDSKVNIKKETIWTKGQKALFVLSKHQTLSGDNLPVDGTNYEGTKTYPTAVTLGDGQAMVAQMLAPESENEDWHSDITNYSDFENLETSTTYYIHTFVFNDTCANGPLYGEPLPAKKISTLLEKAGDIQIKDIKSNSLKVVLPEADENLKYIVAYAEKPLTTDVGTPLSGLLKNGTKYTEGQQTEYREAGYGGDFVIPFTIAKVGVVDSVELSNLRSGKGYYILVWLMREENGEPSYSSDYSGGTARTLYSLPAEVDFVGEKVSIVPIGWETSTYIYKDFDETTMQPIDVPKPHFCIQYTTMSGGEIISAYLDYNRDGVDEDGLLKAHLISSWFDKDDAEKIQTSFRVRFFSMEAEAMLGYTVRPGDSAVFSYQEEGDEAWIRLGVCNNKTEYSSNGSATLNMPLFQPAKNFRYRVDYYHESSEMDITAAYFSIYSMDVAVFEYPAVTDLHTENLSSDSVTIVWKAAEEVAVEAEKYVLCWKERAAEGEYTKVETDRFSYTLNGLKPLTQYAYYVYGIYGGEKGKESEVQYFRTLSDVLDTVKTPAFSVIPGEVEKGTEVVISCGTDNATIYYTTDGTNPTTGSEVYKTPIVIEKETTIKAFAVKSDMVDSKVVEGTYTVKVANESDLLAEVKLYPNPTDGLFYVTVPESAKVEIFTTNGTLVKQLNVAAGQTTLQLNQAGMYFVKVNVNGQFAIRKIVVR